MSAPLRGSIVIFEKLRIETQTGNCKKTAGRQCLATNSHPFWGGWVVTKTFETKTKKRGKGDFPPRPERKKGVAL